MKRLDASSIGSVVTAVVASLCCIGPLLVTIIGVGSIGVFSAFQTYRPFLIGLTVLLLGIAFYLIYRKREVACEDGTCKLESAGKWNKITVWFAAVIAAGTIAFPYLELSIAAAAGPMQNPANGPISIVTLNIESMDCEACAAGLRTTLGRIGGVSRAEVLFAEGRAVVEFDSARVHPQEFIDELDEVGFTATVRKEDRP